MRAPLAQDHETHEAEEDVAEPAPQQGEERPGERVVPHVGLQHGHLELLCREELRGEDDVMPVVERPVLREDPLLRLQQLVDACPRERGEDRDLERVELFAEREADRVPDGLCVVVLPPSTNIPWIRIPFRWIERIACTIWLTDWRFPYELSVFWFTDSNPIQTILQPARAIASNSSLSRATSHRIWQIQPLIPASSIIVSRVRVRAGFAVKLSSQKKYFCFPRAVSSAITFSALRNR